MAINLKSYKLLFFLRYYTDHILLFSYISKLIVMDRVRLFILTCIAAAEKQIHRLTN